MYAYLLASEGIILPAQQLLLDAMNFRTELTKHVLVHRRGLLVEGWDDMLGDGVFDVPLNHRSEVRGQQLSEMI